VLDAHRARHASFNNTIVTITGSAGHHALSGRRRGAAGGCGSSAARRRSTPFAAQVQAAEKGQVSRRRSMVVKNVEVAAWADRVPDASLRGGHSTTCGLKISSISM
jgi:ribosomal protein S11